MNARLSPTSLAGLLRAGAAGIALAGMLTACGGSHAASDSGTAAPGAAASADPGSAAASSAPDAGASPADAGGASAGTPGSRAGGRRLMAKALASVGLTADQKSQIRAIMKAARAESANADPETRRANYKAAMAKMETVLTPDQLTAYHAKMAELRAAQSSPSQ